MRCCLSDPRRLDLEGKISVWKQNNSLKLKIPWPKLKFPDFLWISLTIPWLFWGFPKFPDNSRFSRFSRSVCTLLILTTQSIWIILKRNSTSKAYLCFLANLCLNFSLKNDFSHISSYLITIFLSKASYKHQIVTMALIQVSVWKRGSGDKIIQLK